MEMPSKTDLVNPSTANPALQKTRFALMALAGAVVLAVFLGLGLGWMTVPGAMLVSALLVAPLSYFWVSRVGALSEQEQGSEEMRLLQRDAMLLDSLPQPVMLLDRIDRIEAANAACREAFGADIIGSHIAGVIRAPNALAALRESRYENCAQEAEFSMTGPDKLSALFHVAPVVRESGPVEGEFIVMIRDRTEQKKLERMRTDFIANAGHELRTPLAAILGFIETLQGHAKDDPEAQDRFLGIMQSQTERLLRLVEDLVSLSALELNERRLPEDEVDLCEVAQTVRELMSPVAANYGGVMKPGKTDCSAHIIGDRDQLIQVIQNLADNALKYGTKEDGGAAEVEVSVGHGPGTAFEDADSSGDNPEQIAVRAGCDPSELHFLRVRDFGPGIDKNDLPRLTERFYRTDVEKSHAKGGTGLGLAIVKHIVGRHRGGILIESRPGAGAAFSCYFPPLDTADQETVAGA